MCASSPGLDSRTLPKQQANIKTYTLKSKDIQAAIATFKQILHSCYGPTGHSKIIQNNSGGYITTTSASTQLLQNLTVSKPVLKLMVAAVQGHLSRFGDGGLYCGLLMSNLVETCANLDLHPVLCISVNEHLMRRCLQILDSVKIPVDVSNMEAILCVVRSVIRTKPLCNLTSKEVNYVSKFVLEAFLKAIPNMESNDRLKVSPVQYMTIEGVPPLKSCIFDGILLEATKFMIVTTKNITMRRVQSSQYQGQIRVALYDISMSGDSQNFVDVSYEIQPGVSANEVVLAQMLTVAEKLVHEEVGLVACQKVIHPSVKKFFKEKGVWTLDRLSRLHIDAVQKVTGATILSTFSPDLQKDTYGYLGDIELVELFNKSYLHLQNGSHPVCTLALCSRTQVALEELKNVCNVANQTLALTLSNPMVLPGAGCTETYIANKLCHAMTSINESLLAELGCTHAQYLTAASNFASCFDAVARALEHDGGSHVIDGINHHRYSLPPGLVKDSDWLNRYNKCACGMKIFHCVEKLDGAEELRTVSMEYRVQRSVYANDQSSVPNDESSEPNDQSPVPNVSSESNDESSVPNNKSSEPNDQSPLPSGWSSVPNDESSEPNDRSPVPNVSAESNDESSVPNDKSSESNDQSPLPSCWSSVPNDESSEPNVQSSEPNVQSSIPIDESSVPYGQSSVPKSSNCHPCEAKTTIAAEDTQTNSEEQACMSLVIDCLPVKQNALRVAVETANMVLRIKHTIEDTN